MVCKSLQVEELQIRLGTWKQGVLIWNNYEKSDIEKSFLANENKVNEKINSQKIWTVSENKKKMWKSKTK